MDTSPSTTSHQRLATLAGFGAIGLWSTTVAIVRSLSEQVGAATGMAAVFGLAGVIALASLLRTQGKARALFSLPPKYLLGCGALFVGYMLVLFIAIGMVRTRQEVLEVGLLNYLWPTLTLVASICLLGRKARWWFVPATLLALAGVFLVFTAGSGLSWASFGKNLAANPVAYSLALGAAISWALYSVLTCKWIANASAGGVPLFLLLTGVVLFAFSFSTDEPSRWSLRTVAEILFMGVATAIAYGLWDFSMRRGKVVLVAAGSYLTPLLSTLVSCLYLGVVPDNRLWVGCAVLMLGSVLSWKAMVED
ncbi:MAG: aromatic amino acid DMT transporter YddG [Verrucomicrobiota bacterium]|nr:aromatic amino acid DMT transporter YddG [Verrucomicrobiota bacterium]